MSVALTQAYQGKDITVKKIVTGEVMIKFPPELGLKNIIINNNNDVLITKQKGITLKALKKSNLKQLVERNRLALIFTE